MSTVINGVTLFERDQNYQDHPAFKELRKVSLGDVRFPFGFFLVDEGGKTIVIPGTQEDRRKILIQAFPKIDQASFSQGCHPNPWDSGCHGGCGSMSPGYRCMRMHEEKSRFYACGCVDRS